jgi:response regulator RpfG family c-di-GMP phosphodiesterase
MQRTVPNPSGAPGEIEAGGLPSAPTRVLLADDDGAIRDVVGGILDREGFLTAPASSAEEALEECRARDYPLVLADVRMPAHDGLWLLDQLRTECPSTAVIMLTGFGDTELAVECLRRGATDFLLKPPHRTDLLRAVERALARRRLELARTRYRSSLESRVRERTAELSQALTEIQHSYQSTLDALVQALDAREQETSGHSQRVVRYTLAIAERAGLAQGQIPELARGALLHDIGKIGVRDAILLKAGPLTEPEWLEMRQHPQIGWRMICNGSGYPRRLVGEAIPLGARVFAVADTFDAMTSDRPYRPGTGFTPARREIARCAGTQFDPRCVAAFLSIEEPAWRELAGAER